MAKNPLAELLTRLVFERSANGAPPAIEIAFRHRGAPGDVRHVGGHEIASAGPHGVELRDGTTLPLHRLLAVRRGGEVLWSRRPGPPAEAVASGSPAGEDPADDGPIS